MWTQCERCGASMQAGLASITQFGLTNLCGDQCLSEVEHSDFRNESEALPYRQKEEFESESDLQKCCESGMKQE